MEVIPAIDLRGGRCVRLYQGDYARETVYSDDPGQVAQQWVALGARRLHVVDLDGARDGTPANLTALEQIISSVGTPVQFGGGIRTAETAEKVLDAGVDSVIVGTAAVERSEVVRDLCSRFGSDRVVIGVDTRDREVMLRGWTRGGRVRASELIDRMMELGAKQFMHTDVTRDGTLTEPNFQDVEEIARKRGIKLIAAGGIADLEHLARLAHIGVDGAVVGKALYTRDIDLAEALKLVREITG